MNEPTVLSRVLGDTANRLTISQCEHFAKQTSGNVAADRITFDLVGPKGRIKCRWLDPHMGFFQQIGAKGFLIVSDFIMNHDVWIENIEIQTTETDE